MHAGIRTGIFLLAFACAAGAVGAQATDRDGGTADLAAKPGAEGKSKAKPKAKPKAAARARKSSPRTAYSGTFELQVIYDSNILRSSDGTLLEFRTHSSPQKFRIKTYDDLIVSPKLSFSMARKLIGGRNTSIRFGLTRWQYAENPIKNNDSWSVRIRQQTYPRDFIEASYTYAPSAYIRQLSDRPPYTPRTVPIAWIPFKSARNAFLLGYSRRISDRLTARLDLGRTTRFYNRPFLENDNWEWNGAGDASYTLNPYVKLNGRYAYSSVRARARDSVDETEVLSDDGDPSYERDLYEFELRLLPKRRLWKATMVSLVGQYQAYYFTSKRTPWEDDLHVGRKDQVSMFEAGIDTEPLFGPVAFSAGYRYTQRVSSLPANKGADAADEKDYKDNRAWVSATYPF
jgi:hypothetical protein